MSANPSAAHVGSTTQHEGCALAGVGAPSVLINGKPAWTSSMSVNCPVHVHGVERFDMGSESVLIGGNRVARANTGGGVAGDFLLGAGPPNQIMTVAQTSSSAPLPSAWPPKRTWLADGGVRIALNLINRRSTGVHLAAGLPDPWSPGDKRDDEPAHRFIDDDQLVVVVVVGDPWLPEHGVTMRLFNHLFIVPPKDELLHEFDLPGPIEEYNAYFPRESESSHSSRRRLVLKVLVREGAAGFEPSPLYSNAVIAEHLGEARWISASCDIDIDVLESASDDFPTAVRPRTSSCFTSRSTTEGNGTLDPRGNGWTTEEEHRVIEASDPSEANYLRDRGYGHRRTSHGSTWKKH